MALMASSIEMSFSLSRLRRTLRSMSIGPPPGPRVAGRARRCGVPAAGPGRGPSELHLYPAGAQLGVAELAVLAADFEGDPVLIGGDHPSLDGLLPRWPGVMHPGAGTRSAGARFAGARFAGARIARPGQRYLHQPAGGTAPVTGLGKWA